MEAHVLPLSALVQSQLNVRKRPIDEKALLELADSIQAVGVLQNLVVYPMDNDVYGVAAGQRRLLALQQLVTKGHLASSYRAYSRWLSRANGWSPKRDIDCGPN
nr:ParB/Srx family N-terminal domain-containing protein [Providencia rettgeri]